MHVCVRACVRVCVRARVRACEYALRIFSTDEILRLINTLIIIIHVIDVVRVWAP